MAKTFNYGAGIWATKTGSSMAYNDQNDNYKPTPFSVTRDSIATRVNKQGLIEVVGQDKLRIDYTDSSNGVALLEPSRTNSLLQSNQFDTTWTTSNATVTSGQTGVGGSTDAWLLTASSTSNCRINQNVSGSGVQYISIYAKANTSNFLAINTIVSGTNALAYFDLSKGIVGDTNSGVIDANIKNVGEGWYRCSFTYNDTNTQIRFLVVDANGSIDVTSGNSIYIQYSQLEVGSYATSYIPTSGQSGGVTRAADVANGAGNEQVFNDSEGVLFANIAALADYLTFSVLSISDGGVTNNVGFGYRTSSNVIYTFVGSSINSSTSVTVSDITLQNKVAVKYKSGLFAMWINGFEVYTSPTSFTISGISQLSLDNGAGAADFYGKTKEIGYYDAVLTDAELEALTSYTSFTNMANELNLTIK